MSKRTPKNSKIKHNHYWNQRICHQLVLCRLPADGKEGLCRPPIENGRQSFFDVSWQTAKREVGPTNGLVRENLMAPLFAVL